MKGAIIKSKRIAYPANDAVADDQIFVCVYIYIPIFVVLWMNKLFSMRFGMRDIGET